MQWRDCQWHNLQHPDFVIVVVEPDSVKHEVSTKIARHVARVDELSSTRASGER
jgi:hypothetical protein